MPDYDELVARNAGFLSAEVQNRLRHTSLLIAGCGVGSVIAEVAVRLGCERIVLVDGDTIERHNLNRQCFVDADVGELKVRALARRLSAINPQADIQELPIFIDKHNVNSIVTKANIVFDTIDFIDMSAVISLHDEATNQSKPIIWAASAGWGAGLIYFPVGSTSSIRDLFNLPRSGSVDGYSYTEHFTHFAAKGSSKLPEDVKQALKIALQKMVDGKPCPMAQVAAGSQCMAGLAGTVLVRLLANLPIVAAPRVIHANMSDICALSDFNIG